MFLVYKGVGNICYFFFKYLLGKIIKLICIILYNRIKIIVIEYNFGIDFFGFENK